MKPQHNRFVFHESNLKEEVPVYGIKTNNMNECTSMNVEQEWSHIIFFISRIGKKRMETNFSWHVSTYTAIHVSLLDPVL